MGLGMRPRWLALALLLATVTFVSAGRADEDGGWQTANPAFRVGGAVTGGYASLSRTTSDPTNQMGGFTLGGELRVYPYSDHGLVLAFTNAEAVFGPNVNIADVAYSLRIVGGRPLKGVTGAVYLDLGPSLGLVTHASPTPNHTVVGGRATATFDLHLANFTVGVVLGYRGGVPVGVRDDPWEGALSAVARCGVAFDFGVRRSPQWGVPAWSADGTLIAFLRNDDIYVVDREGRGPPRAIAPVMKPAIRLALALLLLGTACADAASSRYPAITAAPR
jgi:hypothetical protein